MSTSREVSPHCQYDAHDGCPLIDCHCLCHGAGMDQPPAPIPYAGFSPSFAVELSPAEPTGEESRGA
jgi:hypothetical protein